MKKTKKPRIVHPAIDRVELGGSVAADVAEIKHLRVWLYNLHKTSITEPAHRLALMHLCDKFQEVEDRLEVVANKLRAIVIQ